MSSEDDEQQLIQEASSSRRVVDENQTAQLINTDHDWEQIVYGYRKSRWRTILTYTLSLLLAGLPLLIFHWSPAWLLYVTSKRSAFHQADTVLVVETYQKKCKSHYIHKIRLKDLTEESGLSNEGYQDENGTEKPPMKEEAQTPVILADGTKLFVQKYRYFTHKKCTLVWEWSRGAWGRLAGLDAAASCRGMHAAAARAQSGGNNRETMFKIYGENMIKVQVQSYLTLVLLEVFNPFYVFQLFTIAVWIAENYFYYCIAIVIMSTFGVATSVVQTKRNQEKLRTTVESSSRVQIITGNSSREVDSSEITVGDVIVLGANMRLPADAILLGGSVVVNESMLTGESVPVSKTALPRHDKPYNQTEHSSNTLFCGTNVIQTRYYNNEPVTALVIRTGYLTTKGQLVRSILYPIPADFKFDRDSYKYILILTGIAIIGLAYTVALKWSRGLSPGDIILKALDIITIVVPPALPAAMTVGRLYAVSRLRRASVACLNTRAVNVSGSIDLFCFDKTGTLTEDGLDLWGVVPVPSGLPPSLGRAKLPHTLHDLDDLKIGMAVCHSLALIGGELAGDPLDLKMFESTGWSLEEPNVPESNNFEVLTPTVVRPGKPCNINVENYHIPLEVGIVHQNQFVSSLQRSSVVSRVLGEQVYRLYCKGAPETIAKLCVEETVPPNLIEVLSSYAEKGYRVIALSTRPLDVPYTLMQKMTREEMECDLQFLGLVILENRLKGATTGIIRELIEANIHCVMVTGDNIHTAVSVAKECGILPSGERVVRMYTKSEDKIPTVYCENTLHGVPVGKSCPLSIESHYDGPVSQSREWDHGENGAMGKYNIVMCGDTWKVLREHYSCLIPRIIERGVVFARMTSDQKQQLVLDYQALGYYVGMCGDGANDCGALRAAHAGISLSELESSVAAPFTANTDIVCVSRLLREGRAALTTSFGLFNFMVGYSLTEFFSVAFLYFFDSNLTDFQFLFIDVVLIVNFAFFFGKTEAYRGKLCKLPPLTSLLGIVPLCAIFGQIAFIAVAQFLSFYALTMFPWYERHTYEGEEENECWENYAIFSVSMFQYIIMTIVFSHGAPYRRSVITNKHLMLSIILMSAICIYITVAPAKWIISFMELRMPKDVLFSYIILAIASTNFLVALVYERFVIQFLMQEREVLPRCVKERKVRKTPHLLIKRQLREMDYLSGEHVVSYEQENSIVESDSNKIR